MTLGLTNQHISRQLELLPPEILDNQVTIVGAGAIGSWTTLALAKMGFKNITVIDHDEVDIVNMSSQFFGAADIGKNKASALSTRIEEITGHKVIGGNPVYVEAIKEKWTGAKLKGIVIMAVDSMDTRKAIFEANKLNLGCQWVIDARMGAETALLFTMNPNSKDDQESYEKTLYTDQEASPERCAAKSTTYCSLVLSGLVAKTVRDILMKQPYMRNMTFSLKGNDFLAFTRDFK